MGVFGAHLHCVQSEPLNRTGFRLEEEIQIMRVLFKCDPNLVDDLPRPIPSRAALPQWIRDMPVTAFSPSHQGDIRTVKHCPPFLDAMTSGFIIPLPCDIEVRDGVFAWDWPIPEPAAHLHPRSPLSFHVPEQLEGSPLQQAGQIIVKFNSFWTIELEPGWSLLAQHPANRLDLPFRLLSGLVDADRYHDVGILFPAVWLDPDFNGMLPRGTPIAQCFPVKREALQLEFATMPPDAVQAYDEVGQQLIQERGVYSKRFRAPRPRSEGAAQRQSEAVQTEPEPPRGSGR